MEIFIAIRKNTKYLHNKILCKKFYLKNQIRYTKDLLRTRTRVCMWTYKHKYVSHNRMIAHSYRSRTYSSFMISDVHIHEGQITKICDNVIVTNQHVLCMHVMKTVKSSWIDNDGSQRRQWTLHRETTTSIVSLILKKSEVSRHIRLTNIP